MIRVSGPKNEWNAQNTISSHAFRPSTSRNPITSILTTYYVEIWQSTLLEQEPHRSRPLHSLIFGYLTIIEPAVAVG